MASNVNAAAVLASTAAAVLVPSDASDLVSNNTPIVKGPEFNTCAGDLTKLLESFATTGFQATNIGLAIDEINRMRAWRLSDVPATPADDDDLQTFEERNKIKCTIFFSYTSNMISCGVREIIRYLCEHKMIDCMVTTAGGIEEDLMKYIGDFELRGTTLRPKGLNRIGNLLVPNDNYCKFEDFMMPVLEGMADEQEREGTVWTPSKMIQRFGREIKDESSVYYWAWKNDIPVFSPALTDGSIGDMLYFHSYKRPGFFLDIIGDIRAINDIAVQAKCTGMIILGGGLIKHHVCNANLMRNGANFSVFINTGNEFDGSDSGAKPDEAVSWGKIRIDAKPVKVYCEASIAFPLIVSQTFAKTPVKPVAAQPDAAKT